MVKCKIGDIVSYSGDDPTLPKKYLSRIYQVALLKDGECLIIPYPYKERPDKIIGFWTSFNRIKYLGTTKTHPYIDILYK